MENEQNFDTYLGDGLYASYDGYQIELRANSPIEPTDTVSLNDYVIERFLLYIGKLLTMQQTIIEQQKGKLQIIEVKTHDSQKNPD